MKTKRIIHIELKIDGTHKHFYSTSLALLVNKIGYERLGISLQAIRNYLSVNNTNRFENDKCIIRRGDLLCPEKPGNGSKSF